MHRFLLPQLQADNVAGHPIEYLFDEQESRHIAKVLRLVKGDKISITDGKGFLYEGTLVDPGIKEAVVLIANPKADPDLLPNKLHIAIAPTKNPDRTEWFVEKATETGVDEITLLLCDHSERPRMKTDRLERLAMAALKQSKRTRLPIINPMIPFGDFIQTRREGDQFIAWCETDPTSFLADQLKAGNHTTVLIGPEGDFSAGEISQALATGFRPSSLGRYTLRTETAGLAACMMFLQKNHPVR